LAGVDLEANALAPVYETSEWTVGAPLGAAIEQSEVDEYAVSAKCKFGKRDVGAKCAGGEDAIIGFAL
jgi:hypothetical protein